MVDKALAKDLKTAKAIIMSGAVYHKRQRLDKAGTMMDTSAILEIRQTGCKYVSRGGSKLEGALRSFAINPQGWVCADLGSSTGGFTDCLLQHGAEKIFAFDVGKGLLDWKLQGDHRVVLREKFNVRFISGEDLPEPVQLVTADLSFISLGLILPRLKTAFPDAEILLLVKPQFEGRPEEIEKGGLVKDPSKQKEILGRVIQAASKMGFQILGTTPSNLTGQKGNQEYFLWIRTEKEVPQNEPG